MKLVLTAMTIGLVMGPPAWGANGKKNGLRVSRNLLATIAAPAKNAEVRGIYWDVRVPGKQVDYVMLSYDYMYRVSVNGVDAKPFSSIFDLQVVPGAGSFFRGFLYGKKETAVFFNGHQIYQTAKPSKLYVSATGRTFAIGDQVFSTDKAKSISNLGKVCPTPKGESSFAFAPEGELYAYCSEKKPGEVYVHRGTETFGPYGAVADLAFGETNQDLFWTTKGGGRSEAMYNGKALAGFEAPPKCQPETECDPQATGIGLTLYEHLVFIESPQGRFKMFQRKKDKPYLAVKIESDAIRQFKDRLLETRKKAIKSPNEKCELAVENSGKTVRLTLNDEAFDAASDVRAQRFEPKTRTIEYASRVNEKLFWNTVSVPGCF